MPAQDLAEYPSETREGGGTDSERRESGEMVKVEYKLEMAVRHLVRLKIRLNVRALLLGIPDDRNTSCTYTSTGAYSVFVFVALRAAVSF